MFSPKKWALAMVLAGAVIFSGAPAFAMLETYDVEITISGLEEIELAAFDLDVNYDDALLTFAGYTLTDELGSITTGDADDWSLGDDTMGTVNLSVLSYLSDFSTQADGFVLATVSFAGDPSAIPGISLSNITLGDDPAAPIAFTVSGTDINAVPVPSALWLMGSGLIGFVGVRRRDCR